jgi:hypothetical protein
LRITAMIPASIAVTKVLRALGAIVPIESPLGRSLAPRG